MICIDDAFGTLTRIWERFLGDVTDVPVRLKKIEANLTFENVPDALQSCSWFLMTGEPPPIVSDDMETRL